MSFGTGFHDIRIIENCLNDGIQFLHEYKEYLKDIFQIEKEYVKNNISVINKYKSRQEKRYTLPELTTSQRAWIVFLNNMEKKYDEKTAILDKYNSEVVEPLKLIINREEDKKKKQVSFYKELNTFVERYCQENEKNRIKYHESCDAVMNSKKKCDKKLDKLEKASNNKSGEVNDLSDKTNLTGNIINTNNNQSQASVPSAQPINISYLNPNCNCYLYEDGINLEYKDKDVDDNESGPSYLNDKKKMKKGINILNPLIKMNNKKNFYIMSLKVANALKSKLYNEDTPYIFDELQSLNEEIYQYFKEICSKQIEYEIELFNNYNEKNNEILKSLSSINVNKDSTIYLRCYSKEWTKPEIIRFIPTTHWEDREELVVDSKTSIVLKNIIQKGQERMHKINLDINSKTSEYEKFEMICDSYDNNSNYSKKETDIIKNKKTDIMHNIIMAKNIKLICEVQINEISKYLGNDGPKPERQHVFKAKKIINPTICDYCKEKLWGKAYICKLCTFSCHIKCELKVPLECNGVKTKRKSLRINCSQLSNGNNNISSPFIKTPKPYNGNNISKIKEETETNENVVDNEKAKVDNGENSDKSLLNCTEKGEVSKNTIYKCSDKSNDKISNPLGFNIKDILWYIDNNEFPFITADSLVDMPIISELIKKNSLTADEIEMLQMRHQKQLQDYSNESNIINNINKELTKSFTMNSIDNTLFNNLSSSSSSQYFNAHSTINSSGQSYDESLNVNEIENNNDNNEMYGENETISIIETNSITSGVSHSISSYVVSEDENEIINGISNDNSITNISSDDIYENIPLKGFSNHENSEINPDVQPNSINNSTFTHQFSKARSLPMLNNGLDSDEENEEDQNEEHKVKMALERRNSYLREKFYLKNNIDRPHDENFIKMIAMYDYQHQSDDELDLSSNEEVTLIIPDDGSGWAMVSSAKGCGLVPANYLMEIAKVINDYKPNENESDKIQVKSGDILLIVEKDAGSGFTRVRVKDKEGLIPSNFIEPVT